MTTWDSTPEGQNVNQAVAKLRDSYTSVIPGHTDQLRKLAQKPLGG